MGQTTWSAAQIEARPCSSEAFATESMWAAVAAPLLPTQAPICIAATLTQLTSPEAGGETARPAQRRGDRHGKGPAARADRRGRAALAEPPGAGEPAERRAARGARGGLPRDRARRGRRRGDLDRRRRGLLAQRRRRRDRGEVLRRPRRLPLL